MVYYLLDDNCPTSKLDVNKKYNQRVSILSSRGKLLKEEKGRELYIHIY